jgi:predicted RNase H-like HicB family nuclease
MEYPVTGRAQLPDEVLGNGYAAAQVGVRPLRAKQEKTKIYPREPQPNSENPSAEGAMTVHKQLTMVYWKGERFWLGKLLEHPDIMTQGETLEELEDNLKDAYRLLVMDDVPDDHHTKAITL